MWKEPAQKILKRKPPSGQRAGRQKPFAFQSSLHAPREVSRATLSQDQTHQPAHQIKPYAPEYPSTIHLNPVPAYTEIRSASTRKKRILTVSESCTATGPDPSGLHVEITKLAITPCCPSHECSISQQPWVQPADHVRTMCIEQVKPRERRKQSEWQAISFGAGTCKYSCRTPILSRLRAISLNFPCLLSTCGTSGKNSVF
jgi:hypothetical protein